MRIRVNCRGQKVPTTVKSNKVIMHWMWAALRKCWWVHWLHRENCFSDLSSQFHRWIWASAQHKVFQPPTSSLESQLLLSLSVPSVQWTKVCCSWSLRQSSPHLQWVPSGSGVSRGQARVSKQEVMTTRVGWDLLQLYWPRNKSFGALSCAFFWWERSYIWK